jgi:hypothetical protein
MTTMTNSEKPARHNCPWTEEEDHLLHFYWGARAVPWIANKLKRSAWSVTRRALELDLGPFERGTLSMKQFCERSGFLQHQVLRVARSLNMIIRRAQPGSPLAPRPKRRYAIDDDQQEALLEGLLKVTEKSSHVYRDKPGDARSTKGKWGVGKKPPACLRCATNERPHCSLGLCSSCYNRRYKSPKPSSSSGS